MSPEPVKPFANKPTFTPRPSIPANPRRVRGGVKLSRAELEYPESPTATAWLKLTISGVPKAITNEAFEYARAGQAKRVEIAPGRVVAPIQGRAPGAYKTRLEFGVLEAEQWERVIAAMGEQAKFAASLIGGQISEDVIGLFASVEAPILPPLVVPQCTCGHREGARALTPASLGRQREKKARPEIPMAANGADADAVEPTDRSDPQNASAPVAGPGSKLGEVPGEGNGGGDGAGNGGGNEAGNGGGNGAGNGGGNGVWCKHAVCAAMLVADRLASEPLAVLHLRGLPASEVVERLHEKRTAHVDQGPPTPVYSPVVRGASDIAHPPLEACLANFWSSPTDMGELDLPVVEPEVSHPLLRRLGQSPFSDGKFPLVGLLASCYESISEAILKEERGEVESLHPEDEMDLDLDGGGLEGGDEKLND